MTKTKLHAMIAGLSLLATAAHAAPSYTYVDLGGIGGSLSAAYDINDSLQVVGATWTGAAGSTTHATLWSNGTTTDLSALAGNGGSSGSSSASGINNAGQIVGYTSAQGLTRATLWDNGKVVYLGAGGVASAAYDINEHGQAVGTSSDPATLRPVAAQWSASQPGSTILIANHPNGSTAEAINNNGDVVGNGAISTDSGPYIANGGNVAALQSGGKLEPYVLAINDKRQAVGVYTAVSYSADGYNFETRPLMWSDGKSFALPTLGGHSGMAYDINASGLAVGSSNTVDGQTHATLWAKGAAFDLDSFLDAESRAQGWRLYGAAGINDHGDIVGMATRGDYNQEVRAFMLVYQGGSVTPVPEPETYAMVLSSLAMFGVLRRRAKKRGAMRGHEPMLLNS